MLDWHFHIVPPSLHMAKVQCTTSLLFNKVAFDKVRGTRSCFGTESKNRAEHQSEVQDLTFLAES